LTKAKTESSYVVKCALKQTYAARLTTQGVAGLLNTYKTKSHKQS